MRFAPLPILLLAPLALAACRSAPEYVPAEGALGPYSAAAQASGLVFVSGQVGARRGGTFAEEAASAIDRLEDVLAARTLSLADCVQVTVFLTDIANYGRFNEVYEQRFAAPYPARACVAVSALPGGARVEIQAVAASPR